MAGLPGNSRYQEAAGEGWTERDRLLISHDRADARRRRLDYWLTLPASVAPNHIETPQHAVAALGWGRPQPTRSHGGSWPAADTRGVCQCPGAGLALLTAIPRSLSGVAASMEPSARVGHWQRDLVPAFPSGLLALIELRSRLALSRPLGWALLVPVVLVWWGCLTQWLAPLALYRASIRVAAISSMQRWLSISASLGPLCPAAIVLGAGLALTMHTSGCAEPVSACSTSPDHTQRLVRSAAGAMAWLSARFDWLADLG
ncbi:hypothetical protein DSL92_00630 [Billgrantia gudaonensis]|uniref:Uncharacterized protein n=1 Tax=Billgrantia gudaonensis TaxID=376427 RepID=A0A3S0QSC3_9GAMM|nr:hypothetical protein DSL92_00630 [Halomonas gudaonensis]